MGKIIVPERSQVDNEAFSGCKVNCVYVLVSGMFAGSIHSTSSQHSCHTLMLEYFMGKQSI